MSEEKKDTKVEIAKINASRVAGVIWTGKGIAIAGVWVGLGLSGSSDVVQIIGFAFGIITTLMILAVGNTINIED